MKKNDNVVGDCKCDQFYQVKVCRGCDEDCAECLQISGRPYLQPVKKTEDHQPHTSRTVQHAILMLPDVVYWLHWWIPTRLEKHIVTWIERRTLYEYCCSCMLCTLRSSSLDPDSLCLSGVISVWSNIHRESKKTCHQTFVYIFAKYWPIEKFIHCHTVWKISNKLTVEYPTTP